MSIKKMSLVFAVALFSGVFFLPAIALGNGGSVNVQVNEGVVTSPGNVTGVATSTVPGPIVVRATIDGVEIEGSPDIIMEGEVNEFDIPIPEGNAGRRLVITATGPDGSKSRQTRIIQ